MAQVARGGRGTISKLASSLGCQIYISHVVTRLASQSMLPFNVGVVDREMPVASAEASMWRGV